VEKWGKIVQAKGDLKQAGISIFILDNSDFESKLVEETKITSYG
jgi:hypothetical protein